MKLKLPKKVCYYGQHYYCFAFSHDNERWIMYDDRTVKESHQLFVVT
ncbi:hypothetical protein BVRB_5g125570 isoform A [Beta vulgaris subsp. vulgaris]|uniref:Uncharacterized protein n=1 Tax=Beta vulgaris subsp. vulgaris TaxID=3555 RepID=A0A0J8B9G7_BETVV|nr:hypothetical protein BVRB_5g125570 isoform A [Beta vulgaris subsp. vulgaris]